MKTLGRVLRWLGILLLILILYVGAVLLHGTLTDFQPDAVLPLEAGPNNSAGTEQVQDSILSFISWNVGYGGLGAEANFFYDSGSMFFAGSKMVRPEEPLVQKYVDGILQFFQSNQADFYLLQEVDVASKRSYGINQFAAIQEKRPELNGWFGVNYKSPRVPIPIFEPWRAYGRTLSGLATYTSYQATEATRYQLPGEYSWPTRIFQLDRCASVLRFPTQLGPDLLVVNVHNSAYDKGGVLKKQQMAFLKDFFLKEYEKGNYLVIGGDWNQCPPYFPFDSFSPGETAGYEQLNIDAEFLPAEWTWVYDPTTPTNRKVSESYVPKETFTTLIDFFLISPNVKVRKVRGIDQGFQYSDHQPVWMEAQLLRAN